MNVLFRITFLTLKFKSSILNGDDLKDFFKAKFYDDKRLAEIRLQSNPYSIFTNA